MCALGKSACEHRLHTPAFVCYLKYSQEREPRKLLQLSYKYNIPKDYVFSPAPTRQTEEAVLFIRTDIHECMYTCKKALYHVTSGCNEKYGTFQSDTKSKKGPRSVNFLSVATLSKELRVKQVSEQKLLLFISTYCCYHEKALSFSKALLAVLSMFEAVRETTVMGIFKTT